MSRRLCFGVFESLSLSPGFAHGTASLLLQGGREEGGGGKGMGEGEGESEEGREGGMERGREGVRDR
jgi:hypothetical protein